MGQIVAEPDSIPERVTAGIPYFFYDLFGRIVPGVFLTCGTGFACRRGPLIQSILMWAKGASTGEWIFGAGVFVVGSFVAGFLLSELSRLFWLLKIPVSLTYLRNLFGSADGEESVLESSFKSHFGFGLDGDSTERTYLIYCARLCEFVVICRNSALDAVNVRVAGEELLSRSVFWGSVLLFGVCVWLREWRSVVAYFFIGLLSLLSFLHYRKKGIREKFQMFHALCHGEHTLLGDASSRGRGRRAKHDEAGDLTND